MQDSEKTPGAENLKLLEYQKKAADFVIDNSECGLFLEMGLGKTAIVLSAINFLLMTGEVHKVLVIAPLKVAQSTWKQEGAKWIQFQSLRFSMVLGSKKERMDALREKADIYVTNRENVVWLCAELKSHHRDKWPFDMVVLDELSSFKSPKAKRFRALRHFRPQMKRVVGLTGTPVGNGYMDLWAEMYLIDYGKSLGRTFTAYRREYFYALPRNGYAEYRIKKNAEKEIQQKISKRTICMRSEDYLELPPVVKNVDSIYLPTNAQSAYDEMEKKCVLEMSGAEITAVNAAVVISKLLQISSGFIYDEDGITHRVHNEKIKRLIEIMDTATSPVLVFYNFKADAEILKQTFPQARYLQTDQDVQDWNAGNIPLLLAHPKSVGYGLNLQAGGHNVIWYDLTWSLEQYQQANARLHRMGQKHTVVINYLICSGTAEETVYKRLKAKKVSQDDLMEIVSELTRKQHTV